MKTAFMILFLSVLLLGFAVLPVYAQPEGVAQPEEEAAQPEEAGPVAGHWLAVAMAIAAAGCGYGQSKALTAACEGVSRNPGSADTIRIFIFLGLAFIEFLALLTFIVILIQLFG